MKPIKGLLIVLLALTVVFTFGATALAEFGSQAGSSGEGGIQTYPNAKGTKYVGPLAIYYVDAESGGFGLYDLTFLLRLRKGWELYAYSGTATDVGGYTAGPGGIQEAIEAFVESVVIPALYNDCVPLGSDCLDEDPVPEDCNLCPPALLKSVELFTDDETSDCCDGMIYSIMDVTIAVED